MPFAAAERRTTYTIDSLEKGSRLPFTGYAAEPVGLCGAPAGINADIMSGGELSAKLRRGYDDIDAGRVTNAAIAFEQRGKNMR